MSQMLSEGEKQLLKEVQCLFKTYDELFEQHQASIYKICLRLLEDEGDAKDAKQQIYLNTRLNSVRFRGDAPFLHWIGRIATNYCKTLLERRNNKLNRNTTSYDQSPIPDVIDTTAPSIEEIVLKPISAQQLMTTILAKAANKWKVLDYQLFILRTLPSKTTSEPNMTYPEMAALLEKSESTLRGRWRDQVKPILDWIHKEEEETLKEK